MNTLDVISTLEGITTLSDDDKNRAITFAKIFSLPYENKEISAEQQARLTYFLATKVYLQLCLTQSDKVDSFTAGDIKISHNSEQTQYNAKLLYEEAIKNVGDIVGDDGFAFMEV